ncbi:Ankyrin repeat-containing domain protein [Lactarius tabidus]
MLRHCLAPSLRRQLNELPKGLDETYERILDEIESTNQGHHARRLLQCLAIALRPLRAEELAEVLAFDLDATEGEIPKCHPEWRWEDQEQAVLSACSSLISIVDRGNSRVVQFSHFSVKEYLTSNRLAAASADVLRYHILPEPAHLILAHACLGVLLSLDSSSCVKERGDKDDGEGSGRDRANPLLKYAAEHWTSHAQVGSVSSCLKDAMEALFDLNKPYFLDWIRRHDEDINHSLLCFSWVMLKPDPLYYAARCGFLDLVRHLIVKHPEQVNYRGGMLRYPLVAALSRKHFQVAELLVKNGARINVRGDAPLCLVLLFSDDDRVDAVQFLLKYGADINAIGEQGFTSLCLATYRGCLKVATMLLEHKAEIDRPNIVGRTPLHLVSTRMDPDLPGEGERSILARLLVEHGADVDAQDEHNRTPLHFASYYGRSEIAQLLLDHGASHQAESIQGRTPLHEVSQGKCPKPCPGQLCHHYTGPVFNLQRALNVALLLLERGADVNAQDKDHGTPLHLASSLGILEIARLLLDHGATANVENIHGQTPLHLVSQGELFSHENPDVAQLFLELGLKVNARDKDLTTPLHFACSHGNFETALLLLDHGAGPNLPNADGETPLHQTSRGSYAYRDDVPPVAQKLLERGADVNARNKDQATPLHLASYYGKSRTMQVLLDHGAKADAQNADGQTPLHQASHPDIVRLLLERGVDVNARDNDQATPLHRASYQSTTWIVQPLLDHGADAEAQNADGQTPLHLVSHFHTAQVLLKHGVDINARDKDQATPLHLACYHGHADVVETLLDHGAQANAEDIQGQSPLHQVLLGDHHSQSVKMYSWSRKSRAAAVPRLARRLLEHGVDVNAQNKVHETPLHLASRLRLLEMARILLGHGADINVKNAEGKTPLQLASGRKRKAMRRLLSEYSAKQI